MACTEPQCLYSRVTPLVPVRAVWPAQSLSACTRVNFTLPFIMKAVTLQKYIDENLLDSKGRSI